MEYNKDKLFKTILNTYVHIHPINLDKNIKDKILLTLKNNYKDKCTRKYGDILKILRIISYKDNIISNSNLNIIFNVKYEILSLKPTIGLELIAITQLIFSEGILLKINNNIRIFIKECELIYHKYDIENNLFIKKDKLITDELIIINNSNIEQNSLIQFRIKSLKYEINMYTCIGEFIKIL